FIWPSNICYVTARYVEEPFTNQFLDATAQITCPTTYSLIAAEQTCRRVAPVCASGMTTDLTFFKGWNTQAGGDLPTEVPGTSPETPDNFCTEGCNYTNTD